MATAFAGVSMAQTTCATAPQTNPTLRAEGQTELLALMAVTCTNGGTAATTGTVYITTSLPITSKQFTAAGVSTNEATLVLGGTPGAGGSTVTGGTAVQGTVSGNQVSFTLPAAALPVGATTFYIANVRVNASAGSTPQVTESGVLTYNVPATGGALTTANAAIPGSATGGPGYILKTLDSPRLIAATLAGGTQNYVTCIGNPVTTAAAAGVPSFTLNINELVGGAFLTAGAPPGGEQGNYVSGANIGTAQSADVINVTIANLPASATVYVPQAISAGTGAAITTLTLLNSTAATGSAFGALAQGPVVALTPTNGTVTVPYTVTASAAVGAQTFPMPVIVQFAANSASPQTAITVNTSYGPAGAALTGPAASIPTFLASSFTAANASIISSCVTNMLFPFTTNQLGFDTGIAIANASVDNLGTGGKSVAAAQTGTCTLSFYGTGAPSTAVGVADPQGALAAGQTHAFTLSAVAPGFQGYVIASCPFLWAHGFSFITYNLTQNNGVAEGYLAIVLNRGLAAGAAPEVVTF